LFWTMGVGWKITRWTSFTSYFVYTIYSQGDFQTRNFILLVEQLIKKIGKINL
jgi:hypothetical protein